MKKLWLPRFNPQTDYPWAVDFIHVFKEAFTGYNLEVINKTGVDAILKQSNKELICFRRVV